LSREEREQDLWGTSQEIALAKVLRLDKQRSEESVFLSKVGEGEGDGRGAQRGHLGSDPTRPWTQFEL
jgi:hypothetical protein